MIARTQHPADAPAARQSHATASADAGVSSPVERPGAADSAKAPPLAPALPERPSDASPRPAAAPAEPVGDRDAQRDLEALARCLGALLGSAMPLLRIPGGQGAGSPAEHVQGHLGRARRALGRLASLRETHYGHVLVLLYAYVHLGEEHRVGEWHARVRSALLPSSSGKGGKALAAASGALGRRMLLAAEDAYARAPEIASDGRWLVADLASVAELALRGRRRPPLRAPGPRTCVLCEDARPHRRGLCWSCYRKLREANLPLPLRRCDEPGDPLLAWLGMLKPRQLVKLRGALRATLKPKRRATREVIDNGQLDLPGGER